MRRAGLAGGRDAEAARADAGRGSGAGDLFEKIDHHVGHARIEGGMAFGIVLVNGRVVARPNHRDEVRLHVHAFVGEHGVRARHLDRSHLVGAERNGWRGVNVQVHAGVLGEVDHIVVADHLGDLHRGDIYRMGQRLAQRDLAEEFFGEVTRLVGLVVEPESGRLIEDLRGRRQHDRRSGRHAGVHCGGVNEWLEDGARLACGDDVVQLADAVVASSNQRLDFGGVRIDGD